MTAPAPTPGPTQAPHRAAGLRVLVLNNYPLDAVWDEVRRGEKPDHHLYGLNHLAELGVNFEIVPAAAASPWSWVDRLCRATRLPFPLGRLGPQLAAARWPRPVDLVFCACGAEANLLALRRAAGLWQTPIVVLQHHPLNPGRLAAVRAPYLQRTVRGIDAFVTLSRAVAAQINAEFTPRHAAAASFPWGPDAAFYPPAAGAGEGFVAAGRTGRDFASFGTAATRAGVAARIICPPWEVTPAFSSFGSNVAVQVVPADQLLTYPQLLDAMSSSRALAIPLYESGDTLAGLTGLLDAIGLGRPVIMTRNAFIDLDIEALGIGRWIAPDDAVGWEDALRWFDSHPVEAAAMGRRARALLEDGFDSGAFALRLADTFAAVCGRVASPTPSLIS